MQKHWERLWHIWSQPREATRDIIENVKMTPGQVFQAFGVLAIVIALIDMIATYVLVAKTEWTVWDEPIGEEVSIGWYMAGIALTIALFYVYVWFTRVVIGWFGAKVDKNELSVVTVYGIALGIVVQVASAVSTIVLPDTESGLWIWVAINISLYVWVTVLWIMMIAELAEWKTIWKSVGVQAVIFGVSMIVAMIVFAVIFIFFMFGLELTPEMCVEMEGVWNTVLDTCEFPDMY